MSTGTPSVSIDPVPAVGAAVEALLQAICVAMDTLTPGETSGVLTEVAAHLARVGEAQDTRRRRCIERTLTTTTVAPGFGRRS